MKLFIIFALVLAVAFAQESDHEGGAGSGTEGGGHPHPDCPGLHFAKSVKMTTLGTQK